MPTDIHRTNETKTARPDTWTQLRRTQTRYYLRIRRTLRQHSPQHHHPQHHLQNPQTNKWHTTTTHRGSLRHPNKIPTSKPTWRTPWNGLPHLTLTTYSTDNTPLTIHSTDNTLNWQHTPLATHSTDKTLYRQHALLLTALSPELANSICTLATICTLLSLMYIATPEQLASYLFITRTSHLYHTRPQNAPHATHRFCVLLLNARTQPSFDPTDDGVDAETSLSLSLHFYLSSPPLHFFSRAHIGSVYSLGKCVWAPKSCSPPWRIIRADKKTSLNKRSELASKCMSPLESLLPVQLSTSNILKPVSDLPQHQHVTKYRFLWTTHQSLRPSQFTCIFFCQSRITPLCFSLCFFPLFHFPLFFPTFFSQFFPSVSHPSSHPLTPVSTAPPPPIPIYPRSCVACFVYLPEDRPRPWNF